MLTVRFHFNGEFVNDGKILQYVGGSEQMSYIDRDKVSLPEVIGHLKDHCAVEEGTLLHWLFPGRELKSGLRALVDDKVCIEMAGVTSEGEVAEIYVESPTFLQESDNGSGRTSNYEDELGDMDVADEEDTEAEEPRRQIVVRKSCSREEIQKQLLALEVFYTSPSKKGKEKKEDVRGKKKAACPDSSTDSDYLPGDTCSSEDDEEAAEILKNFKEFKKKQKTGQRATLDDVVLEGAAHAFPVGFEGYDEGNETPYAGSSDDEDSLEEIGPNGELCRKEDGCIRYKKNGKPQFQLAMKFRSKKQFKKAIIRYGLAERKVINFIKDDPKRVRAKCDWRHCPWVCLLSNNSRSESWQIVTFEDYHTCPPRRDNRLVTGRRIAEKYEKFIITNPSWNFVSMKETVQEEMFADVSISKLKRAKALVMKKALDSMKGQYNRLYDYQAELLRSNPGSTVIVVKDPEFEEPIFQRMYICLDALKKGFIAGCRKVVGLDGCFFKGAITGELLCAIGRDANNQMYPIAWAVVERENNDSWDWFCDLLFKDIQVGDGSGWVFISDQQKVFHWLLLFTVLMS